MRYVFLVLVLCGLFMGACEDDEPKPPSPYTVLIPKVYAQVKGSVQDFHLGIAYVRDERTGLCFAVERVNYVGIAQVSCGVVEGARQRMGLFQ